MKAVEGMIRSSYPFLLQEKDGVVIMGGQRGEQPEPAFTSSDKYDLQFGGRSHVLYQHSLGYGLMRARRHVHRLVDFMLTLQGTKPKQDVKVTMDGVFRGTTDWVVQLVLAKDMYVVLSLFFPSSNFISFSLLSPSLFLCSFPLLSLFSFSLLPPSFILPPFSIPTTIQVYKRH